MQQRIQLFFVSLFCLNALISCELKQNADETRDTNNKVYYFFQSIQYAMQATEIAKNLSDFGGAVVAAPRGSTFMTWVSPEAGCLYAMDDQIDFKPVRYLEVGNLVLSDAQGNASNIERAQEGGSYWKNNLALGQGMATIRTEDQSINFAFSDKFRVLEHNADIELTVLNNHETFALPSPEIVMDDHPDFYAEINRNSAHAIDLVAPKHTDYVRVLISDGVSPQENSVVCYAAPGERIMIPQGAFSHFRASTDGRITVDFISVRHRQEFASFQESVVISQTRHIHGRRDLSIGGRLEPIYFGLLRVR